MKFIIREDKLHRLIFKFLDNQNFVEIQKKQDEICFVNKDGINFIQIFYNKNNKNCFIYFKLIDDIAEFFSIEKEISQMIIGNWMEDKLQMKVGRTGRLAQIEVKV